MNYFICVSSAKSYKWPHKRPLKTKEKLLLICVASGWGQACYCSFLLQLHQWETEKTSPYLTRKKKLGFATFISQHTTEMLFSGTAWGLKLICWPVWDRKAGSSQFFRENEQVVIFRVQIKSVILTSLTLTWYAHHGQAKSQALLSLINKSLDTFDGALLI